MRILPDRPCEMHLCSSASHSPLVRPVEPRCAENATGIYLLGIKTSMAGFVPPPGTYVTDYNYYYSGSASGAAAVGVALRRVGNVNVQANVNVDGNAFIDLPTVLWVVPDKVLGGNLGLGVIVPNGWKKVDVDLNVRRHADVAADQSDAHRRAAVRIRR